MLWLTKKGHQTLTRGLKFRETRIFTNINNNNNNNGGIKFNIIIVYKIKNGLLCIGVTDKH